jgi:hypothetical protein
MITASGLSGPRRWMCARSGTWPRIRQLQNKIAQTTEQFPQPRLQTDDGNQEIADLHAKEDLLLENYSWVDKSQGKARIPIERAMELVAKQGLPVAQHAEAATLLTGDTQG